MPDTDTAQNRKERPVTISSGPLTATFRPEHGGRMTRLEHAALGHILVPTPDDAFSSGGAAFVTDATSPARFDWPRSGAYPLFPYHNRLIGAAFTHAGHTHRVTPNPSLAPDAMHGPAHRRQWHVTAQDSDTIALALDYPADDEWPFDFRAIQFFHLFPDRLEIRLTLINTGHTSMPAGMGWHPYIAAGYGRPIIPGATKQWPLDTIAVPTGAPPLSRDPLAPLPDDVFTIHLSQWHTATAVTDGGAHLALTADPGLPHLAAHRMPAYACLEPVSHVAGALGWADEERITAGMTVLDAGQRMEAILALAISGR